MIIVAKLWNGRCIQANGYARQYNVVDKSLYIPRPTKVSLGEKMGYMLSEMSVVVKS
jgi:hypothetical protein